MLPCTYSGTPAVSRRNSGGRRPPPAGTHPVVSAPAGGGAGVQMGSRRNAARVAADAAASWRPASSASASRRRAVAARRWLQPPVARVSARKPREKCATYLMIVWLANAKVKLQALEHERRRSRRNSSARLSVSAQRQAAREERSTTGCRVPDLVADTLRHPRA